MFVVGFWFINSTKLRKFFSWYNTLLKCFHCWMVFNLLEWLNWTKQGTLSIALVRAVKERDAMWWHLGCEVGCMDAFQFMKIIWSTHLWFIYIFVEYIIHSCIFKLDNNDVLDFINFFPAYIDIITLRGLVSFYLYPEKNLHWACWMNLLMYVEFWFQNESFQISVLF